MNNKNDEFKNFKGIHYNNDKAIKYFEKGAHFAYSDLYSRLTNLMHSSDYLSTTNESIAEASKELKSTNLIIKQESNLKTDSQTNNLVNRNPVIPPNNKQSKYNFILPKIDTGRGISNKLSDILISNTKLNYKQNSDIQLKSHQSIKLKQSSNIVASDFKNFQNKHLLNNKFKLNLINHEKVKSINEIKKSIYMKTSNSNEKSKKNLVSNYKNNMEIYKIANKKQFEIRFMNKQRNTNEK